MGPVSKRRGNRPLQNYVLRSVVQNHVPFCAALETSTARMSSAAENGSAEPGPVNVAEVEITAPAEVTDPANNTSSSAIASNPPLAADASTGADNCANSAEPHATRVFKTSPILDPPDLSPSGNSVKTATKSAMSGTDSPADRVADLPMYKEKENSKQQGGIEVYSIHGEQAAKRRAIGELIFFSGTNDLRRCKQIASVWSIDVRSSSVKDYDSRTPL
eukprot:gene14011-19947_t